MGNTLLYKDDPDTRHKYKKTKTAHIASQWFPTASPERLRPICRFMLWTLYNDDMYEEVDSLEIRHVHEQSLPDFGEWYDTVVNRAHYISMTLSG